MSFCFFVSVAMTFSEAETKVNKEIASIAAAQNGNAVDPGVTSRSDKPPEERPATAIGEVTSRPETSGGNVPAEAPKEKPKPENKPVKGSLRGANMPMITELGKMFMMYNIITASPFKSFYKQVFTLECVLCSLQFSTFSPNFASNIKRI